MAKDKKKSKKGKVAGGVGIAAVLAVLALFGGKSLGLGFGDGFGLGSGNDTQVNSDAENQTDEEKEPAENPQENATAVSVEVRQGQYFIGGEEKSLEDIEALLAAEDTAETSFVLVNNYAAAKAWDDVKALFTEYEIAVTEQ